MTSFADIKTIERSELKQKLDRGDDFALVMTLNDWAFKAAHIPGSVHFPTQDDVYAALSEDKEIIVYCSDQDCLASQFAYVGLVDEGYTNVRRYAGGLADWQEAGYQLDGE